MIFNYYITEDEDGKLYFYSDNVGYDCFVDDDNHLCYSDNDYDSEGNVDNVWQWEVGLIVDESMNEDELKEKYEDAGGDSWFNFGREVVRKGEKGNE